MKKYLKRITCVLLLITMLCFQTVSAELGNGLDNGLLTTVTQNNAGITSKFDNLFNDVFGTILTLLKVVAVAGIMITGVKYMYAGPSDKGQIKQSLIYIIIGTILVFGVELFVNLISNAWNSAI